jgi:hypothetical protein
MAQAVTSGRSRSATRVREARFEDYEKVTALQLRNGLTTRSYAGWTALWANNPAYSRRSAFPIGWVLEGPRGEIGGYLGNLPAEYRLQGRAVRAATPYSWAVDPLHRRHSLALFYQFLKQREVDLFVCTTPNPIAETVLRAFKFCRTPSGTWDQTAFWITGYRGFARSVLRAAPVPLPPVLAHPLSATLFLTDVLRTSTGTNHADHGLDLCSSFDARFDVFWSALESENQNRLLAVRTRETLEWHFGSALAQGKAWILAASSGGRLVAYSIFDRRDEPRLRLKRIRLVDFQALRGFEELLRPVLAWMLRQCRREQIHVAENVGCWLRRFRVLGMAACHHRQLKCWQFYYRTRDKELHEHLQNPNVWMPSSFDGDSSL